MSMEFAWFEMFPQMWTIYREYLTSLTNLSAETWISIVIHDELYQFGCTYSHEFSSKRVHM